MNINNLELEEHHRIIRHLESQIDRMLREKQVGNLEDAYWLISRQALLARRKLRRMAYER